MTPTHKNPAYKKRVAVAPYNFVPLPEAILTTMSSLPSHDIYDDTLLTGKLTCTLTTSSPLYVRAARTQAEFEMGKTPSDPYYGETRETLLIPGSSLRGMLRNLVEVVSYSRISPVTKKPLFYRTVDVSSIGKAYGARMSGGDAGEQGWFTLANAGYMEMKNGDYFIRPAREIFGTQHFRVHEDIAVEVIPGLTPMATPRENRKWSPNRAYKWAREKVWFKPVAPTSHLPESPTFYADVIDMRHQIDRPEGNGWEEGYFIAGGWVPSPKGGKGKKRHWIVGPASENEDELIFISDEDVELYRERTGGSTQAVEKQKMSVLPAKGGEKIPCFYTFWKDEEGQQRVAFGHTGMFRLPYLKSPGEMLPDALKNMDGYDLAESMFGFVDQTKNDRSAVAGRVSVTDAVFKGEDPKKAVMDEMVFSDQALSGPKPTTVQHYLTQSAPDHPENLKHYDSDPNTETSLRGHKFYWHVGASEEFQKRLSRAPELRDDDKEKRNVFKPVKANQPFSFDIHFENLHPYELGALLWVLDKARGPYRLKLGMGKPFGLGSIEISFDVALSDRQNRYSALFADDQWNEGWMSPEAKDPKVSEARDRFAQYVLQDKRINPGDVKSVDDLPRIKELLALLNWQNKPVEEMTRYMDLDEFTGRKPIFKELTGKASRRPVLPTATKVLDNRWFAGLPAEPPRSRTDNAGGSRSMPTASSRPASRTPAIRVVPEVKTPPPARRDRPPKPELPEPVEKETSQLVPGDIITGIAEKNTGAGKEVWLTLEHGGKNDRATIPAGTSTIKRYKKGEKVLLEVRAIEGDPEDGFLITCHPVDL